MKNIYKISIPIALIIMICSIFYQRTTGPTYPKRFTIEHEGAMHKVKLLRSHGGETDAPITLPLITESMKASITYKRFPTKDEWSTAEFIQENGELVAKLPHQPPAGKHIYYITIDMGGGVEKILGSEEEPIMIRFKGDVPGFILWPHIIFMFLSMLLSGIALTEALFKTESFYTITKLTTGCLLIGGLMLGPLVQKYAFGVYWAGFPFDWDLTDNKLLVGVIFWVGALLLNRKKRNPIATIVAAVVLLGVYSIPHSMMGSQYDYEKGEVVTDR